MDFIRIPAHFRNFFHGKIGVCDQILRICNAQTNQIGLKRNVKQRGVLVLEIGNADAERISDFLNGIFFPGLGLHGQAQVLETDAVRAVSTCRFFFCICMSKVIEQHFKKQISI